jgi:hypothetical protein
VYIVCHGTQLYNSVHPAGVIHGPHWMVRVSKHRSNGASSSPFQLCLKKRYKPSLAADTRVWNDKCSSQSSSLGLSPAAFQFIDEITRLGVLFRVITIACWTRDPHPPRQWVDVAVRRSDLG